ncbi:MAG: DUF3237 domain-containing protein [Rhizobiaceae bacterium]
MISTDILISLEHVFDISAEIAQPITGGASRNGQRRIIAITGGTVSGPRLQGRVMPGGADYEFIRPDGTSRVEAHYVMEASDGSPIYICNKGIYAAPQPVSDRLDRGEAVGTDEYYFRCVPVFDAPPGPHEWLNDRIFVGSCIFSIDAVRISVFVVN